MGFFDRIKRKAVPTFGGYYEMLNGYVPVFSSWDGRLYENALVRAAVESIATHAGKLQITIKGSANPILQTRLKKAPNEFQTWNQFLRKLATILYMNNTAFIVPVLGNMGQVTAICPISPVKYELVNANNQPWVRFSFDNGKTTAFRLEEIGIVNRHQYKSELFGEINTALSETMELMSIQRQAIEESAKNSASYRFMAQVNNFARPDDLKKERERFNSTAFQGDGGGMLLFPNTYTNIKELSARTYSVDKDQLALIEKNVFDYFGVNNEILQNKAFGDSWSAFYEGCIEPLAIQLSEVLTRMLFTDKEIGCGNEIMFTSNRLQYMTNADKLNVSTQLLDRGVITINQALEIWNLPGIGAEGDVRIIRGEYYNADDKTNAEVINPSEEEENGE